MSMWHLMSHDVITSLIGITRKCNYTHDHVFLIYMTASLLPLCQTQTVKLNEEISKPAATFEALGVTWNFYFSKKKKKKKLLAKHFLNKICLLTLVICSNHFIHYCSAGLLEIFHTLRSQSGVLPLFPRRPHWFTKCKRGTTNSNQIEHIMLNYVTLIICSERNTE